MKAERIQDAAQAVLREIELLRQEKSRLLIAIDGRCAAGKTTLAAHLQKACECNVIHMDDFFLTPELRIARRLSQPGGNVDHARFLQEVLIPLRQGEAFAYRPYDCHTQKMASGIAVEPLALTIIEGAYSCHPALYAYYDLRIFCTVDKAEQLRRIRQRNGETGLVQFQEKWIPLEERYFSAYCIKEGCKLCFQMSQAQ